MKHTKEFATLITEVIGEVETIGLVACDDYNGKTYVIYNRDILGISRMKKRI